MEAEKVLTAACDWAVNQQMKFSIDKYTVVHTGRHRPSFVLHMKCGLWADHCCSGTSPWGCRSCFHQLLPSVLGCTQESKPNERNGAQTRKHQFSSTEIQHWCPGHSAQQEHSGANRIGERQQAWGMFWSSFHIRKDWVNSRSSAWKSGVLEGAAVWGTPCQRML